MGLFSHHVVGVDIGHSSVKVVGLQLGGKPSFVGCKEITMDPKYLRKEGFDNPALIGQALREAMKTAAPRPIVTNQAYSVISESLAFRKVLELPVIPDQNELAEAIRLQVAEFLPEPLETMEVDFQQMGIQADGTSQQVMVIAVPRKIIQQYLAVFAEAKMAIKAIEVKSTAVARAIVGTKEEEGVLLVDIGSEVSSISLYEAGIIRVNGTINLGGNIIRDSDTGEIDEDALPQRIKRLVGSLADEVDHTLKFYANRTAGHGKVKEIRLAGGGSMIAGVQEALAKEVELPVRAGEAVVKLPPFCDRRFLGALGCAMYPLAEAA